MEPKLKKRVTFCPSLKDVPDKNPKDTKKSANGKNSEWLRGYMLFSLGLSYPRDLKVLDEVSLPGIARYIKDNKCRNIIVMSGAGISTSAGIPDYRSKDLGIYNNIDKNVFSYEYFMKDPVPYFTAKKEVFLGDFKPTPCHYFIRLLHEKGLLLRHYTQVGGPIRILRHYTQNIDGLDRLAGLPQDKLVEAHGCLQVSYCMECGADYTWHWMKEQIYLHTVPRCIEEGCGGVVRPDIVMFGENLSVWFNTMSEEDFPECDLLIIMGTSLKVRPFSTLTNSVFVHVPRLYINLEPAEPAAKHILTGLMFGNTFDFDSEDKYRDVFKQSTCDDGCLELADLIGWKDELQKMVELEHKRLDEKIQLNQQTNKKTTP